MSKRIKTQADLKTTAEIDALCEAGVQAWRKAPGRARSRVFAWRGQRFRVHATLFRLMVDTMDGQPLVCRWN